MTKFMLHPFHLVSISPWPILMSFNLMNNFIILINWFHNMNMNYMWSLLSFMTSILCMSQWWRDIMRESTFQGLHTMMVYKNMRLGMLLFIISEILFFLSFFWAYFHFSLSPSIEIGQSWPPKNITPFNPMDIPLLNTIVLISSGMTITWSHYSMLNMQFSESYSSLSYTIMLGLYFTYLQLFEYKSACFTISDSVYGSIFFLMTGFHGLHVIIGTLFMMFMMYRMSMLQFSSTHHFGFESASWYWHFVDIIWLFLYMSVYWWSYN